VTTEVRIRASKIGSGVSFANRIIERTLAVKPRNGGSPPKDMILIEKRNFSLSLRKEAFKVFSLFFLKAARGHTIKASVKI